MLKSTSDQNHLKIYSISEIDLSIQVLKRLINLAKPTTKGLVDSLNNLNIKEEEEEGSKRYHLITKYYSAILNVNMIDITKYKDLDFPNPEGDHDHVNQVSIIVFDPIDKERLIDFLSTFNDLNSELIMVITLSNQSHSHHLDQIQESCLEFGFEFYDYDTLNEASMALQCVAWPKIERHDRKSQIFEADLYEENEMSRIPDDSKTPNDLPVNNLSEIQWSLSDESDKQNQLLKEVDLNSTSDDRFEDDFSPFVSSNLTSSSTTFTPFNESDYDQLEDQDLESTAEEYQELSRFLFNSNSNQIELDQLDLGDLLNKINDLKTLGSQMNDEDRKKLASQVSLLIESKLE
ncbi:hypothetical protein DFH28DRAFT_882187 [Melampsora americana]|nr:hypothetical protein DFH28DRAFT_882187 [Melampsora americana]